MDFHGPDVLLKVSQQLIVEPPDDKKDPRQFPLDFVFPKQVILESPLMLPNGFRNAGPLELTRSSCENGWLNLEWTKARGVAGTQKLVRQ